jgi:hypothetical protein
MLTRFILSLPVWLIGTFILTWPIVPVAVLLADKEGRLPRIFRWWETHDNLGYAGLDEEETVRKFTEKYGKRLGLIRWLWRNKAYTLRYDLGMRLDDHDWTITKIRGSEEHRKIGPSYLYVEGTANGKRFFEFLPSLGLYWIRIYARIGWKLSGLLDGVNGGSSGIYTGITPRLKR